VAIGDNFQSSLETTDLLKELGAKKVVSRASEDVQAKFLLRNGADAIVYPERQLANWTAVRYTSNHIFDYMELDETHAIIEVQTPTDWVGKSIGELDIRKKYHLNILGIKEKGQLNLSIHPETAFGQGQTILVLGRTKQMQKVFHL
jgi:trk system potassium uptake protein TrkA